jgi:hypothetical protein
MRLHSLETVSNVLFKLALGRAIPKSDLHERAADFGVHFIRKLLFEILNPLLHVVALPRVLDGPTQIHHHANTSTFI